MCEDFLVFTVEGGGEGEIEGEGVRENVGLAMEGFAEGMVTGG